MPEHRGEPRYLCSELVTLDWPDKSRRTRKAVVLLENISASGACLQAEVPVLEKTQVRIVCRKKEFRGAVRYCIFRDGSYFLGVQFDPDSRWSKARYTPEHLLDPRTVKSRRPLIPPRTMFAVS